MDTYCPFLACRRILQQTNWTAILLIILCGTPELAGECPRQCECKWKSGKESVLCLNAHMIEIPVELDAGTQVLDLTGNDVTIIPHDAFNRANLINLQKVFVAKCRLKTIERYAFRKLINLVELDLSYNLLTMIPSHTFDSTPELRELKISGNPIHRVFNDAFYHVPQLVRLEMSDCRVSIIEPRAFIGLESSLEWLKIDGNKLIDISPDSITNLHNLHGLELAGNPWNCSCNLRPLREWMLKENVPYGIPPVCRFPHRLTSKSWDKIDLDDFACVPHALASDVNAHGVEGKNITMSCMIGGVPEPSVRWVVRNRVIANLTGNTVIPAAQGKKIYMVNMQQNESNLTIVTADVQDAGIYTCAAENKAGRVEASVILAISRKPLESPLTTKVLVTSFIVATMFVIVSSLATVLICSFRKRRKIGRWDAQRRAESYEKIEMKHGGSANNSSSKGPIENCFLKPYGENGISVVGQSARRNGDYRNVPSEDDGTGCEDNIETSFNFPVKRTNSKKLKKGNAVKSPIADGNSSSGQIQENKRDLHIPRLIEFSDITPDSGASSLSDQFDPIKSGKPSEMTSTNWSQTNNNKKSTYANTSNVFISENCHILENIFNENRTSESDCDADKKFPDLLDISNSSNNPSNTSSSSAFCTLPRKKNKFVKTISESQSPLLLSESLSQYGSSNFGGADLSLGGSRRLSIDSYSSYPKSIQMKNKNGGRSNSYMNLVQLPNGNGKSNPSLPSSPIKETVSKGFSPAATPLLDFSSLTSRNTIIGPAKLPTTSTAASAVVASASNAYDYHAAQLERFLEEYKNLQEQLCKMKQTCDTIRKKETAGRINLGQSAKFADPVMYTAASLSGSTVLPEDVTTNPKGILRNRSFIPGQPDPPPYWLHRNALFKRLQNPDSDLFHS